MARETRNPFFGTAPGKKKQKELFLFAKKMRSLGLDNAFLAKTKGGSSLGYQNEYTVVKFRLSRYRNIELLPDWHIYGTEAVEMKRNSSKKQEQEQVKGADGRSLLLSAP